jgi:hypothetical protein
MRYVSAFVAFLVAVPANADSGITTKSNNY